MHYHLKCHVHTHGTVAHMHHNIDQAARMTITIIYIAYLKSVTPPDSLRSTSYNCNN